MTVDFETVLRDWEGNPLPDGNMPIADGGKPLTLINVCMRVCMSPQPDDAKNPAKKGDMYQLAMKARESIGNPGKELESGDIAALKDRIETSEYGPLVVGQAHLILEGKATGIQ